MRRAAMFSIFANLFYVWLNRRLLGPPFCTVFILFWYHTLWRLWKSPLYALDRMRTKRQSLNIIIKVVLTLQLHRKRWWRSQVTVDDTLEIADWWLQTAMYFPSEFPGHLDHSATLDWAWLCSLAYSCVCTQLLHCLEAGHSRKALAPAS